MMLEATGEIANIVTGRLKNAFDGANLAVVCGLPVIARLSEPWRASQEAQGVHVLCREPDGPVECTMTLEPLPITPDGEAATEAATLEAAAQGAE